MTTEAMNMWTYQDVITNRVFVCPNAEMTTSPTEGWLVIRGDIIEVIEDTFTNVSDAGFVSGATIRPSTIEERKMYEESMLVFRVKNLFGGSAMAALWSGVFDRAIPAEVKRLAAQFPGLKSTVRGIVIAEVNRVFDSWERDK